MADRADQRDELAVVEDRRDNGDVEEMAGAQPGIVGDEHVAGLQRLRREGLQQRLAADMSVRLNTGIARGECASDWPSASRISQAKSCISPMISEKAVRMTVSQDSSEMVISRLHMISSPTGSASSARAASDGRQRGRRLLRRGGDADGQHD